MAWAVAITTLGTASFAGMPSWAAASEQPVTLPALRNVPADAAPCAKASGRRAEDAPWTLSALDLSRAWQVTRGAGVTVAVVDTGVGTDIPALAGRVSSLGGAGSDCAGHGSFAAGLIAAAPVEGSGMVGVAPQASVLAVRGTDGRGVASADLVAAGIRAAVDGGADVIYVGEALLTGRTELTAAVSYATRRDVLVVAPAAPDTAPVSADNGSPDPTARPYFPAFLPQVLSVSDFGPDGTRPDKAPQPFAPDLAAPGDAVVSTGPSGSGHYIGSGSSLAAAQVAGAAALVRARYPHMTAAQVTRQLQATAYPAEPARLDPFAAVSAILPARRQTAKEDPPARIVPSAPAATRQRALAVAGGCVVLILLIAGAAVVIPRGRARRWRAAQR